MAKLRVALVARVIKLEESVVEEFLPRLGASASENLFAAEAQPSDLANNLKAMSSFDPTNTFLRIEVSHE